MGRKVDWTSIFEQAIGSIFATVLVAAFALVIQAVTQKEINYWIWIAIATFLFLALGAFVFQSLRRILKSIGTRFIQNWQIAALSTIVLVATWFLYSDANRLLSLIIPPILVLVTFLLTRSHAHIHGYRNSERSRPRLGTRRYSRTHQFSRHLDTIRETQKVDISGLGLRFLNLMKRYPPFLDTEHGIPVFSRETEQALTEFFRAMQFVAERGDNIRGGSFYQVAEQDDFASIAQHVYGDSKYEEIIKEKNGIRNSVPIGTYIALPRIDIANPDTPSSFLDYQVSKAEGDDELRQSIESIRNEYGLLRDEVMPLLKMVYAAARMTMTE